MKAILLLFTLIVAALTVHAGILNVPENYLTIQAAINASTNGDTVVVAPGTYQENVIFRGKKIVVTSRFYLNSDPAFILNTIIDGSAPAHPDSGSCVRITSGEDSTTALQGFTLMGGHGTLWKDEHSSGRYWEGGGILIALSSPTITNNLIRDNNVNRSGGASTGGGGIRLGDGSPRILNNIIIGNAGMYGGGIVSNYASPIIRNNIVAYNTVSQGVAGPTYGGGGLWCNGNIAGNKIENNTIVGNSATGGGSSGAQGKGGGMIAVFGATINTRNNIIWGNTQTTGAQVGVASGTALVNFSDVEGGFAGTGNINLNPQFEDTSFYLSSASPCIDGGDTNVAFNDPQNPSIPSEALWPSRGGVRNDMGAYGGPWRNVLAQILTEVSAQSGEVVPTQFALDQNYPNPFNPTTTIEFQIPAAGNVVLEVFNILGNEIRTLMQGNLGAGSYKLPFDATGLSSGVYFYRLSSNGVAVTKRMLLVR